MNFPMTTQRVRVLNGPADMFTAFDPSGDDVWCTFAEQEARTNDGFCQFCGSTEHAPVALPGDLPDETNDCEECGEGRHESAECPNRDAFAVEDWNAR